MTDSPEIILVQDSREQAGYGSGGLFQSQYVVGTLTHGDYSILGLEELIAIERKSLVDLLGSLTSGRDRFETELKRARSYHRFYVLVEAKPSDLLVESFGKLSRAHPRSIWGTICTWHSRYVPFIFGEDRNTSARLCEAILVAYGKEFFKKTNCMTRAARRAISP